MKQNKLSIAVTGGIASGKSAVSAILKELGASVVIADNINRELWNNANYIQALKCAFPSVIDKGVPNKTKLKHLIFENRLEREKLNRLAHPLIIAEILKQKEQSENIFVAEIPLLYEMETEVNFDRILVVISDRDKRVKRLCARDQVSIEFAEKMIDTQPTDELLLNIATDIIHNDGNIDNLRASVTDLYLKWTKMMNGK